MARALDTAGRLLALTVFHFVAWSLAAAAVGPEIDMGDVPPEAILAPMLAVCALHSGVLALLVLRSHWSGWRLAFALFAVFFGVRRARSEPDARCRVYRSSTILPIEGDRR